MKMDTIKNEKMKKFKLYEQRLGSDSKKLISQYNQLKTYNEYLHKRQEKAKKMIKETGERIERTSKDQLKKKPILKRGVLVSLHN